MLVVDKVGRLRLERLVNRPSVRAFGGRPGGLAYWN